MASPEGGVKWLAAEGSRRAHALREHSPKMHAPPGVRMSMCGRIAWHRTAREAEPGVQHCGGCLRALALRDNVTPTNHERSLP